MTDKLIHFITIHSRVNGEWKKPIESLKIECNGEIVKTDLALMKRIEFPKDNHHIYPYNEKIDLSLKRNDVNCVDCLRKEIDFLKSEVKKWNVAWHKDTEIIGKACWEFPYFMEINRDKWEKMIEQFNKTKE